MDLQFMQQRFPSAQVRSVATAFGPAYVVLMPGATGAGVTDEQITRRVGLAFADLILLKGPLPKNPLNQTAIVFVPGELQDSLGRKMFWQDTWAGKGPENHVAVYGVTDAFRADGVLALFVVDEPFAPVRHELRHLLWFWNFSDAICGGEQVYRIVGHGGPCDPYAGDPSGGNKEP